MIGEPIMLQQTLTFLNGLIVMDQPAIHALVETRVPCQDLLAHPTVQVVQNDGLWEVGFLGVLNGLFGTIPEGPKKGWGYITAVFSEDGQLVSFRSTLDEAVRPA